MEEILKLDLVFQYSKRSETETPPYEEAEKSRSISFYIFFLTLLLSRSLYAIYPKEFFICIKSNKAYINLSYFCPLAAKSYIC